MTGRLAMHWCAFMRFVVNTSMIDRCVKIRIEDGLQVFELPEALEYLVAV